ncbi:DDE-type integrase/transposase/recombinase [Streptomyces cellulosae]
MSAVPADAVPEPPSAPTSANSPSPESSRVALERYRALVPYLQDGVTLKTAAASVQVPYRTLQRWLAAYRSSGLAGLDRAPRRDKGRRKLPADLVAFIEGLALKRPRQPVAVVHRQAASVAARRGWPVPTYATVYEIVTCIDPALQVMAHQGTKRYREVYKLVYRREAAAPNDIWQADHTQLDLWVIAPSGKPARPWLTVIEDDHSRAVAGYAVNLEAPSALITALAFRHAIWRKSEPDWHVCGIPPVFHLDHGADFTSTHLEQVMADLRVQPVFAKKGQPHGHGKIERLIGTVTHMCLPHLPGHAPRGTTDRAGQAKLTLPELDAAIGRFIREVYNQRPHSETRQPPQARWEAGAFIPPHARKPRATRPAPDDRRQTPQDPHRTASTSNRCGSSPRSWPTTSLPAGPGDSAGSQRPDGPGLRASLQPDGLPGRSERWRAGEDRVLAAGRRHESAYVGPQDHRRTAAAGTGPRTAHPNGPLLASWPSPSPCALLTDGRSDSSGGPSPVPRQSAPSPRAADRPARDQSSYSREVDKAPGDGVTTQT